MIITMTVICSFKTGSLFLERNSRTLQFLIMELGLLLFAQLVYQNVAKYLMLGKLYNCDRLSTNHSERQIFSPVLKHVCTPITFEKQIPGSRVRFGHAFLIRSLVESLLSTIFWSLKFFQSNQFNPRYADFCMISLRLNMAKFLRGQ